MLEKNKQAVNKTNAANVWTAFVTIDTAKIGESRALRRDEIVQ